MYLSPVIFAINTEIKNKNKEEYSAVMKTGNSYSRFSVNNGQKLHRLQSSSVQSIVNRGSVVTISSNTSVPQMASLKCKYGASWGPALGLNQGIQNS